MIISLGCCHALQAQVVTVIDQETLQPIENVLIYNQSQTLSYHTDYFGKSTEAQFKEDELVTFSHPSYEEYTVLWGTLTESGYEIRIRERIIQIDELVVSANRWEQDKKEIPHKIVSISPKSIEFSNPQTTADMLAQTSQVFVQKSQLGGGSPIIRGFAANSVLIVVDGVRMNNAIFRGGNLQNVISIDPFSLQNAEVLFGPGSVMYGSDALGGVMHFKTKTPGFSGEGDTKISGNAILRYASANHERTAHTDLTIRGYKVNNFTSVTFSEFDHLTTGDKRTSSFPDFGKRFQYVQRILYQDMIVDNPDFNEQIFSGYHQFNLLNKLGVRLGKKTDVSYTFNYSNTSDIPRYDRLTETDEQGYFTTAEWFYGPQEWMTNSLQLNVYQRTGLYDAMKIIATWQKLEESRNDRDLNDDSLRTRTEKVDVITVNIDMEKKIGERQEVFYGLEWFYNKVNSTGILTNLLTGETSPTTPRYPDGGSNYSGLAAYISHNWKATEKVTITSGLRYNQIWLDARLLDTGSLDFPFDELKINNRAVNGNLGMVWTPSKSWQINLLFSTGFRAPNIDDIGKIFAGSNDIVTVPNPELKPEFTYNGELTIARTIVDKLKVSATGYFTLLDNAIVQDDYTFNGMDSIFFDGELSKVQALVNTSSAQIYGGSFQLNYAIHPNLNLTGSYTISEGEDSKNRPLRHTVPSFGAATLTYRYQKLRCQLNFKFNAKRSFDDLAPGEQQKTHLYTEDGTLAWQTLNFEGSYHFSKGFTLTAGVENIFDQHYRPYSSGISAAGRNFIVALKAGF
ncbi:MAG: TonB-dependent receptor [Cyclobacteriaceae bacterium]|nr:TonB-dependent receptor [Cyclobacteriaceae bacterium]